jgi:hypothetical protein
MPTPPTTHGQLRNLINTILVVLVLAALGAWVYGVYVLTTGPGIVLGISFLALGLFAMLFGVLVYSQVFLLQKFVSYSYRAYEVMLAAAELQRRQEEHIRTIAENSNLSDWAKRIVYREKDYEYLRDSIHGAIVRQDWEAAQHLISDMETEFGYRDEAAHLHEQLDKARKATIDERISAAVARFDKLCDEHKWAQAVAECRRLQSLYPDEARVGSLFEEIERRRDEVKLQLLKDYEEAVRNDDVERAHRLLFALDQYLMPAEAEHLKESARNVFRARLEQIKTRFSIAVSYKQFHNAIAAGEQLIREFPNSGYAQEISKLMPTLRDRARKQPTPHVSAAERLSTS